MKFVRLLLLFSGALLASGPGVTDLLSEPGPTFRIPQAELSEPLTFIVYGDQRFTDPANTTATNPKVRRWLVNRIVEDRPAAVILNGDVPLAGGNAHDYAVFQSETEPWRRAGLRVYPSLGNHELKGHLDDCLEHWWSTFPQLRNRRWYSAQLGEAFYIIALDSGLPLTPGSEQYRWIKGQFEQLPNTIRSVVITLHHPPVADMQTQYEVDHNPRPNEMALRDYLAEVAPRLRAQIVVSAGHIHNYERHVLGGVVYLVSGGGGAKPYIVERTPDDLYVSNTFPNFHYVRFRLSAGLLKGEMLRVADPEAAVPVWEVRDTFELPLKNPSNP